MDRHDRHWSRPLCLSPAAHYLFGGRRDQPVDEIADPNADVEAWVEQAFDVERVRKYVSQLPDRERVVIQLRYGFAGDPLTVRETAAFLGVSATAVHSSEHRALDLLRGRYARAGFTRDP